MMRMRPLIVTAATVLALDQISKVLVVQVMGLKTLGVIQVLPPFLTFRMAWNRGINFGLLSGHTDLTRWLLIALAVIIAGWVIFWVYRERAGRAGLISAGLLVGGAAGNVLDRLMYGAVADFLNMSCCGFDNPYAFNIADVAVFLGAVGLILFTGHKKPA